MRLLWLFLVYLALTNAKKRHMKKDEPRHVDLALETALIFDPKDAKFDISLIRTLRSYLDQLQDLILRKSDKKVLRSIEPKKPYLLGEFLSDLGRYILDYKNDNVKSLTVALNSIIEDYYPAGTAFHKIIFDPRLKVFLKNVIKEWSESEPTEIKKDLQNLYSETAYNGTFVNLIEVLNGFFDEPSDSKQFSKLAKKFKKFPKTSQKLDKLIEKTLNFIVFDKFNTLNFTQKNKLVEQLGKVAEYVSVRFRNKALDPDSVFAYKRTSDNETSNDVAVKALPKKTSEREFSESDRESFVVDPDDSLEKITRDSEEKVAKIKEINDVHHEIVFKKNIEINVQKSATPKTTKIVTSLTNATTKHLDVGTTKATMPLKNHTATTNKDIKNIALKLWTVKTF